MLSRFPRWVFPVVAAALAAVGLAVWLRVARLHGIDSGSAGTAAVANVAGDWPVEKPVVVPPPVGPAMNSDEEYANAALTAALEPYRRDDFASAAMSLEGFVATHSESPDGWLYLGASRLLSGDAMRALPALDKARMLGHGIGVWYVSVRDDRHLELEWLSATAEARTGAIEPARARLEVLCALPGPLQVRACAAKESLKR
jgi:hypothetical protein